MRAGDNLTTSEILLRWITICPSSWSPLLNSVGYSMCMQLYACIYLWYMIYATYLINLGQSWSTLSILIHFDIVSDIVCILWRKWSPSLFDCCKDMSTGSPASGQPFLARARNMHWNESFDVNSTPCFTPEQVAMLCRHSDRKGDRKGDQKGDHIWNICELRVHCPSIAYSPLFESNCIYFNIHDVTSCCWHFGRCHQGFHQQTGRGCQDTRSDWLFQHQLSAFGANASPWWPPGGRLRLA